MMEVDGLYLRGWYTPPVDPSALSAKEEGDVDCAWKLGVRGVICGFFVNLTVSVTIGRVE